jgi:hypothetical protein
MPRKKLPYQEGDWFAVPLRTPGYALGLVARSDGRGGALGYFFGPRRESVPTLADISDLQPADAISIERFGDLGFLEGEWPIIGKHPVWDRDQWPMPDFGHVDIVSGRPVKRIYCEQTLRLLREEPATHDEICHLPKDRLAGSGAVEIRLTKLLCPDVDLNT